MSGHKQYDHSWAKGNDKLWDEKFEEWEKRDWSQWLETNLSFPFVVKRTDDEDAVLFFNKISDKPFQLGHTMKVLSIHGEDDYYGVVVRVREERRIGYVPLADVEVISHDDENYWPMMEYAHWFGNR
ncbi:MAG: calcium-binding protein [Pseudomonadota bacterium]